MGNVCAGLSFDEPSNPSQSPTHYRSPAAPPPADPGRGSALVESKPPALPTLLGRLSKPDSDWDKWSVVELENWCRESIRARPTQSAIAILVLSSEKGALLDLVCEGFNGTTLQGDAALRLRKGRIDFHGQWARLQLRGPHVSTR